MLKVYAPPKEIPVPDLCAETWQKDHAEFTERLRAWCQANGSGDMKGETISFPVADGQALYMIFSSRPLAIIHMPLADAYEFRYVERLTLKDVRAQVERSRNLAALFARRATA